MTPKTNKTNHLVLKITAGKIVTTSIMKNRLSQDYINLDNQLPTSSDNS